jgi:hypothetical protein
MGLDMMARTVDVRPDSDVDFDLNEYMECSEPLHEWRKHPDLHGWMAELYRSKGGKGQDGMDGPHTFNCVPVLLTSEDLDSLEIAVRFRMLPHTEGFFFGESEPEDQTGDLEFIRKARAVIADGKFVFYTSWW